MNSALIMDENPISVLIVEDDPSVGHSMMDVLRTTGFEPTLVTTADQAHDAMLDIDFDVILLDLQLGSERGESLIQSVRASGVATPPIVILSAMAPAVAQVAFKQLGAAAVLGKDRDMHEIVRTIRQAAKGAD